MPCGGLFRYYLPGGYKFNCVIAITETGCDMGYFGICRVAACFDITCQAVIYSTVSSLLPRQGVTRDIFKLDAPRGCSISSLTQKVYAYPQYPVTQPVMGKAARRSVPASDIYRSIRFWLCRLDTRRNYFLRLFSCFFA